MWGTVHDGGEVVDGSLEAKLMEAGEEGLDVARVCPPLEEVADCHLGCELFGLDEA